MAVAKGPGCRFESVHWYRFLLELEASRCKPRVLLAVIGSAFMSSNEQITAFIGQSSRQQGLYNRDWPALCGRLSMLSP